MLEEKKRETVYWLGTHCVSLKCNHNPKLDVFIAYTGNMLELRELIIYQYLASVMYSVNMQIQWLNQLDL